MRNNRFEEVVGDTSHEALLNANERFGEGSFEIVEAKQFTVPKLFGMIKKEKHRLVVKLKNNPSNQPTNPRLNSKANDYGKSFQKNRLDTDIPIPNFIADEGLPKLQTAEEKLTYTYGDLQHRPRKVNGLRSIQEGSSQPMPQKLDKNTDREESDKILAKLRERTNRTRIEPIQAVKPAPSPIITDHPNPLIDRESIRTTIINDGVVNTELLKQFEGVVQELKNTIKQLNDEAAYIAKQQNAQIILPKGLQEFKQCLLDIETPINITKEIINDIATYLPPADQEYTFKVARAYENWCVSKLKFSNELNFNLKNSPKIIALIGPTGVGKTTTIAKLAAMHALDAKNRKNIAFFTLDTYRIAAPEQLEHYAQHLGVTLEIIYHCSEIQAKLQEHQDKDLIIVDTAGRCQKETKELENLYVFLNQMPNLVKYLVLSATTKYSDMIETINNYKIVGYDRLIFTKLDETNSVGPLLAVMAQQDSPLAYITNGQMVPNNIVKADFEYFYNNLLADSIVLK